MYAIRSPHVIKTWKHDGLRRFFETGSKAGINAQHAKKLQLQLSALNVAAKPQDMGAPGWRLHELKGREAGAWSVTVNGNWRLTFRFEGTDAVLVDYRDYH
jgi:toxin HigB-1